MSELIYSKKQLNPLIEKFKIDVKNNDVFKQIIEAFDGQPNYQVWAIKSVFGNVCSLELILRIKDWAEANQTEIKNLIKGNLVLYKTKTDFSRLIDEMSGLEMIAATRNTINKFNTSQREMLKTNVLGLVSNGMEAFHNDEFREWATIFAKMEKLVNYRKEKLISTSSAIYDLKFLKSHISSALMATYKWDKEDMLAYFHNNITDSKIVYDKESVVVAQINSFNTSKLLCGNGRTGWCLTREQRYFNQYVVEPRDAKQYFLFDFSKREDDELAHIGFTVRRNEGITNAHSTKNYSLLGDGITYHGTHVNINDALAKCGIPRRVFIRLGDLKRYRWDEKGFLEYLERDNSNEIAVSLHENHRLIVRPLTIQALRALIEHTNIKHSNIAISDKSKVYIIFDFNLEKDDDNSIVLLQFVQDKYGTDALTKVVDAYDAKMDNASCEKYFKQVGITPDMFLNKEAIDPSVLLHKLIDENKEKEAIALVESDDKVDVNFEFNQTLPIFSAIEKKMYDLFFTIVNNKNFDCTTCDSFGESLLQSLLFNYMPLTARNVNDDHNKSVKKMIDLVLESKNFDFNVQDINLDTAVNIACERPELLWVAEKLISNPNVNVNIVNDFNCTALGTAIRKKNINAIKLLAARKDLVVREEDLELAKDNGIKLDEYVDISHIGKIENAPSEEDTLISDLSKIFEKAFSAKQ